MDTLEIARAYEDAIQLVRERTYSHPLESQMLLWTLKQLENVSDYLQQEAWKEMHSAFKHEARSEVRP